MSSSDWREFDRDTRSAGWRIGMWVIVILLFIGLIGGLFWGFRVVTSPIKGKGDSVVIKNEARNRIAAQEAYVAGLNEVKRADRQLDVLAEAKGDSAAAKTRYVGAVSYCQTVVADYNALGDKYRSADFIPEGYPAVIDDTDPTTDCKESTAP
jgi:hypothetical protein